MNSSIEIKNKKAEFQYEITDKWIAGIQLYGTEIKSIRLGKVSLIDSYCQFHELELYVLMHISEYERGGFINHEPKRERKLLLTHRELVKIKKKAEVRGFTIVPTRLFISERGFAKLEIALARGKRSFDKREDMKTKDSKREIDRHMKDER